MEKEIKRLTPYEAGKELGMNAESVRAGLRQGKFPFGTAFQGKKRKMELFNNSK